MLKSMTAFGNSSLTNNFGQFSVEVQSVNKKYLDIYVNLPKEFQRFELFVKKIASEMVTRGSLKISFFINLQVSSPLVVKPNLLFAEQLRDAWEAIAVKLDVKESFQLSLISQEDGLFNYIDNREQDSEFEAIFKELLTESFKGFRQMKLTEGSLLEKDIRERLEKLSVSLQKIEERSGNATRKYRERLVSRLHEVLPGNSFETDERVIKEIALLAEKVDIAEEITRFKAHINHFIQLMEGSDHSGKTLEFIIQEMNRETNTIGSKSLDIEISHLVVELKSELEKIREQIQNVE